MAHDVAAFAQDSIITPLTSLGPSDFPNRVVLSEDVWFVDFFAPVSCQSEWLCQHIFSFMKYVLCHNYLCRQSLSAFFNRFWAFNFVVSH